MFERRRKIRVAGVAAVAATALLAAGCGSSSNGSSNTGTTAVKNAVATVANLNGAGANMIFPFQTTQYYSVTNYEDFMYQMVLPLYMFGGNSTDHHGELLAVAGQPAGLQQRRQDRRDQPQGLEVVQRRDRQRQGPHLLPEPARVREGQLRRLHARPAAGQHGLLLGHRREPGDPAAQAGLRRELLHLQPAGHPLPVPDGL